MATAKRAALVEPKKGTLAWYQAENKRLTKPITDFKDDRLKPLLEAANKEAEVQGYCETYGEILTAIGAPGLAQSWTVNLSFFFKGTEQEVEVLAGIPAEYDGWGSDRKLVKAAVEGTLEVFLAANKNITAINFDYYL